MLCRRHIFDLYLYTYISLKYKHEAVLPTSDLYINMGS